MQMRFVSLEESKRSRLGRGNGFFYQQLAVRL